LAPTNHESYLVPIESTTGWYSVPQIETVLKGLSYDLIIVDGPKRNGRHGFLHNFELFDSTAAIIIDDVNRPNIKLMADLIQKILDRPYRVINTDEKRAFAVFERTRMML